MSREAAVRSQVGLPTTVAHPCQQVRARKCMVEPGRSRQKLAATGLKVRVSELDVRANPLDKADFDPKRNPQAFAYQAAMYKYVIDSYLRYVPAAQRAGITIWGVTDADSWIILQQKKLDAPLLFNADYTKKPAYSGVLQGLKGQSN